MALRPAGGDIQGGLLPPFPPRSPEPAILPLTASFTGARSADTGRLMVRRLATPALTAALTLAACRAAPPGAGADRAGGDADPAAAASRLPTGKRLDPAGVSHELGSMPLAIALSPAGDRLIVLLNGWREQGVQVVDRASGRVVQTLLQEAAFLGLAFSPDGQTLFASGGNQDVVYRYRWADGAATLADSIVLAPKRGEAGTRYPAGLALSADGSRLYVAENLGDALAVVDVATGRVVQRIGTERYPYAVVVAPDGTVYVSAWGGHTVSVLRPAPASAGTLVEARRIVVGRHPSALMLNGDGSRLYVASASTDQVAVVDTKALRVLTRLLDHGPAGPHEGSTPNALALSADGRRLFVAEADNNAVAVFDLGASAGGGAAGADDRLAGRIPMEWYPTALAVRGDTMFVVNGKGRGTGPNRGGPSPLNSLHGGRRSYTLGQTSGTLIIAPLAGAAGPELSALTARNAIANGWTGASGQRGTSVAAGRYPPFEHVIYIIKENRTYDQVLGDLRQGDGDTSQLFFPRPVSPNHHALAERFGIFDRFFVNAEVSGDGHNWSVGAYAGDYLVKTIASHYSKRGRTYDYEGANRDTVPDDEEDDANSPVNGYLWNLAQRAGITFRNFGEFVRADGADPDAPAPAGYSGVKPFLRAHTSPDYPGWNLDILDQRRADVWIAELGGYVRQGSMPALQILRLPNDHTAGAAAKHPTPRAMMADNDLALGRIIEALSRSPFWKSTVVFVLEDDAQNGSDHVDSHRSPLFVISPYSRPGAIHRFANTTDVIATVEEILGLESLSQFDFYGRPLRGIFADTPDLAPYAALRPSVPLDERNTSVGRNAVESERLDLRWEDVADEELFNRILWRAIKGDRVPVPVPRRMSALEVARGQ